jgi:lysophospholipase L1-like esterase
MNIGNPFIIEDATGRIGLRSAIFAAIGVALMLFSGCKSEIHVLAIGDSWAYSWQSAMEDEVRSHDREIVVYNMAIPGATAEWWATQSALGEVKQLLRDNRRIKWCVISLGANDLLQGYRLHGHGDEIFNRMDRDIRKVIDQLLEVSPELKINIHGYDYLNFEQSPLCRQLGENVFGGSTRFKNSLIERLTDNAFAIAKDYPQATATRLVGAMQEAAGIADAPNPDLPSPTSMMEDNDCIHPNFNGYRAMQRRIYASFFGALEHQ